MLYDVIKSKHLKYVPSTKTCMYWKCRLEWVKYADWCSQPQNMALIHHPRMSHQPNDPKYKICCHYAETFISILNHPIKIKHLASWRPYIIRWWVILFRGGGPPADPRRGGVPVCNMHQGEGDRDESPFPRTGGGPWWVTLSKKGWGAVMSHPNGEWAREEGGSTNHSQGEGVGGRLC